MKRVVVICAVCLSSFGFSQGALGEVTGQVVAKTNEVGIFGAHVYILDNGRVYQQKTDPDGGFRISGIPAGKYLLNIQHGEDTMKHISVNVPMEGIDRLGIIKFDSKLQILQSANASAKGRIKMIDGNLPVLQISAEEIKRSAVKFNPKQMIAAATSDVKLSDDGEITFRGARKGDMIYMVDGMKSSEVSPLPSCSIGRMMIYTGGIPAKYGDTMGGVVVVETKSYFDLYRNWVGEQIKTGKR